MNLCEQFPPRLRDKAAVALGISKLVYDIIFDRRTNYPEVTTWDRKPRKEQEKEQDNQEEENEDTPEGDENQVLM